MCENGAAIWTKLCYLHRASYILQKCKNAVKFAETKPLIWMRFDAWEVGQFVALVKYVKECAMEDGWGLGHNSVFDLESAGQ